MIDVEPLIVSGLDRLVPLPRGERADWSNVVVRAGLGHHPRRSRARLAVAAALVAIATTILVATPVGAAIANGIGDFSAWLTGHPGKPASSAEQRAFDRATHAWSGFPAGTELRKLVQMRAGGDTFTLFGFRGAGSLCLRLDVSGRESLQSLACAPLSSLQARSAPALVLSSDFGVGWRRPSLQGPFPFGAPDSAVTFGIVADGVRQISLDHSDRAETRATVAGDAFLAVDAKPSQTERVTHVWAAGAGKRVEIPFVPAPTPFAWTTQATASHLSVHGPSKVQRVVHGGAIRWFARRQLRGTAVPATVHHIVGVLPNIIFAREITPDPNEPERMVVSIRPAGNVYFHGRLRNNLQVCAELVGGRYRGGDCSPAGRLFSTAPFAYGISQDQGNQYVIISGLASDDVARLELFLGTGRQISVPLHDNGYFVEASRSDYPLRLVAYDADDRVIGIKTFGGGPVMPQQPQPVAGAHWRTVFHNAVGDVYVAPSTGGGSCYAIRLHEGGEGVDCQPRLLPRAGMQLGTGWSKAGTHLTGRVGAAVARVVVTLRDGRVVNAEPRAGYVLVALPRKSTWDQARRLVATITAYDAHGHVLARQRR